jgi:hypothetical protein
LGAPDWILGGWVVLENKVCYHNYTTPANERGPASRLQAAPSENRLSSRSKLPKLERARFWGYSEIYCVAVCARAGGAAPYQRGRGPPAGAAAPAPGAAGHIRRGPQYPVRRCGGTPGGSVVARCRSTAAEHDQKCSQTVAGGGDGGGFLLRRYRWIWAATARRDLAGIG